MKILVSIPVHEKPEVINDLILNIRKFVKNSVIVLHISNSFYGKYNENDIIHDDDVLINPEHLITSWGNIYTTHISNFIYAKKSVEFDYILLQASNDMFVRSGIEEYICKYDAGFNRRIIWQDDSLWWPAACAVQDIALKKIMNYCGVTRIVASQVEGSFYKKDVFEYIVNVLECVITKDDILKFNFYGREEVYYSTIASKVVDFQKCGYPTTFSEVQRFDTWIFEIRKIIYKINKVFLHYFISYRILNKIIVVINDILFKSRIYKIRKSDIQKIIRTGKHVLNFLNDYPGYFYLYDSIFSVKRVDRRYDDPIRKYIRNLNMK